MSKQWLKMTWLLVLGVAILALVACGGADGTNEQEEAGGDNGDNNEAAGEDVTVEEQDYPSTVRIGSASQGGTYYVYAGGLANLLEEHLSVTSNVEVTGGPVHNMQLLHTQDAELGMVTMGPLHEGYTGEGEWVDEPMDDIRVVFPMYTTPFHWWSLEETGVTDVFGLEGQRVGVGPAGGTPGTYLPMIHESLGLGTDNVQAGADDMVSQMLDGQLDYIGFAAGIPIPGVQEVEAQRDINLFGIDGEQRDQILEELPYFYEYTIPADTYGSLDEDLETIAMYNFGVVHMNANEDFVYDLVKAYHENIDQMISTHASATESEDPEAILNNEEFPLHPGAIRYYEEVGVELPDALYPPEWDEQE